MKNQSNRTSRARSDHIRRTTLTLVVASALLQPGPAAAIVAITRQAVGGTTCESDADDNNSTWSIANDPRCHPAAGTGASGVGNPGTNVIMYSSQGTTQTEDSIAVGGYLDVWQRATFWDGVDMQNTTITNLAPGATAPRPRPPRRVALHWARAPAWARTAAWPSAVAPPPRRQALSRWAPAR